MKQQNSQNGRSFFDESRRNNVFERMRPEERIVAPSKPLDTCSSIRMMLYDFGLINERIFGSEIVLLDSSMRCVLELKNYFQNLISSCNYLV